MWVCRLRIHDHRVTPLHPLLRCAESSRSATIDETIVMPARHFVQLREKIHYRLGILRPRHWEEQITKYPWLYGALGDPGADVMFICESPSLAGVRKAKSPMGGPCDFDTQWTGDPAFRRDRRFRAVLCDLGLKRGGIWERGGWNCYITNVIKQAAFADKSKQRTRKEQERVACQWSKILQWELNNVRPDRIFCVGGKAHRLVKWLCANDRLATNARCRRIWHYSARRGDEEVQREMRRGVEPYL